MKYTLLILSTGFALFSMFFGSGNLVYPLMVGQESGGHYVMAAVGILLTGVLVPFLGVTAMMLYKGDTKSFFGTMGKPATFWFPLIALSLMGPFGVLARCITVAHGSFRLLFPDVGLIAFSIAACLLLFLITFNKNKIVPLLGSILTPFLLLSLGAISVLGLQQGEVPDLALATRWTALENGFFKGYQMMDLLAAFFFSIFIVKHLEAHNKDGLNSSNLKTFLLATLVGGGLLSIIYISLVALGAIYAPFLTNVPPQEMLGVVAYQAMGPMSAPVVCAAVVLACLTTAVVLATLFSDFLKNEVTNNKLSTHVSMGITLLIAFAVSTLDFNGIASFIAPILEALYPALIVLTVLNICTKVWGFKERRWPVVLTLIAKLATI